MEFEWDHAKDAVNRRKHGIAFTTATAVFLDPRRRTFEDTRYPYGETRWMTVVMIRGREYSVIYTVRGASIRIISARTSNARERTFYAEGPLQT